MSKYSTIKDITSVIVETLLLDIIAGHGKDMIPMPVSTGDTEEEEYLEEIKSFWCGQQEVSRYDLLATILGYCTSEEDLPGIAKNIVEHYPENECKLTNDFITGAIHRFRNGGETATKEQADITEIPTNEQSSTITNGPDSNSASQKESEPLDVVEDNVDIIVPAHVQPMKAAKTTSAANNKKMQEYKEANAARMATAMEREAIASANRK